MIAEMSLKTLTTRVKVFLHLLSVIIMLSFVTLMTITYGMYMHELGLARTLLLYLASVAIAILLHEGLHGLFFWLFGGHVVFGAKFRTPMGPIFWASSLGRYSRNKFRIIALAPQMLTVVLLLFVFLADIHAIIGMSCLVIVAVNFGGGVFDFYAVKFVGKYPQNYQIEDTKDGLRVYRQ